MLILVSFGVVLAGLLGVVDGMKMVAVRDMGVVPGLFVIRAAVMFRGLTMVLGGGFVVFGGLLVMVGELACILDLVPPLWRAGSP